VRRVTLIRQITLLILFYFHCRVRVQDENTAALEDVQVCRQAFISLHGITHRRVEYISTALKLDRRAPEDGRGKHNNRPHKLTQSKINTVMNHIRSFKGRKAHYSGMNLKVE